jgi:hypothetical protein
MLNRYLLGLAYGVQPLTPAWIDATVRGGMAAAPSEFRLAAGRVGDQVKKGGGGG